MKYTIVAVGILITFIAVWVVDAWLYASGWPTISQTVVYFSHFSYLVPCLIGMFVGGLMVHFFESGDRK